MANAQKVIDSIIYNDTPYTAAEGADVLVILTEWNQFRALNFGKIKSVMNSLTLVGLRNICSKDAVEKHGFSCMGIGRPG